MGEETHWPRLRLIAPWVNFSVSAVIMVFFVPSSGCSRAPRGLSSHARAVHDHQPVGMWLVRYLEVYPSLYGDAPPCRSDCGRSGSRSASSGSGRRCYLAFMNAFPRVRAVLMTSPYRDEVQVPVNPETMEPLPAHE